MAILLSPTDVFCEVKQLVVRDDGEATGGAEPYLWSVFFKIDGDTVTAKLTIDNLNTSLKLDGEGTVTSPDRGSHGNLELPGGEIKAGGLWEPKIKKINIPGEVGRFDTTIKPIPLEISLEPGSWLADSIDDAVLSVQKLIDWFTQDQGCPGVQGNANEILAQFGAEFVSDVIGGLPGAFGGIYILMEEDLVAETMAERGRRELRDQFKNELKKVIIPSISLDQQEPSREAMDAIEKRIKKAVIQAMIDGIQFWEVLAILDKDDILGTINVQMSHLQIAFGETQQIDADFTPAGDGDWSLHGQIGKTS